MKKYYLENMEISIVDWLCYICMKWRSIIVMMLVFALLMGGYSYIKPSAEPKEVEVSTDMLRLLDYYCLQDSHQQYLQESPLMQMDADNVHCLNLKYYISLEDVAEIDASHVMNTVDVLVESYENELRAGSLHKEIAEKSNGMIDASYVSELLSVNREQESSMLTTDEFQLIVGKQYSTQTAGFLSVTIKGFDEKFCQMVAECINSKLVETKVELSDEVCSHTLQLTSTSAVVIFDKEILNNRYEMLSKAQAISTNILNIEKTLTDAEKDYVKKILSGEINLETALAEQELQSVNAELPETAMIPKSVSIKYVLIGLFVGAFFMAGIWTIKYIMSGKLRTADDVEAMWNVKTYVCKSEDKKRFCVDKFFYNIKNSGKHMFAENELMEVLIAEIRILADKQGLRNFFVTGTKLSDGDKKYADNLKKAFVDTDISLTMGNNVLYNPASLELLADADAVLLFEHINESTYIEICKELQTCADKEKTVIGCVLSGVE